MNLQSKITLAGQTTVPKAVRESLMLQAGDVLTWVEVDEGVFQVLVSAQDAMAMAGMFHNPDRPAVNIEDMEGAIAQAAASSSGVTR